MTQPPEDPSNVELSTGEEFDNPGGVSRATVGQVAILVLHRDGRSNAWGNDIAAALSEQLAQLEADDGVRACVLTGAGKNFCSGADISRQDSHRVMSSGEYLKSLTADTRSGFTMMQRFRKPVICAVQGHAVGAGFLLALNCDVIFASASAKFALPQGRLGIVPAGGGLLRLAQWVGRGRALEIALSGRKVGSDEAKAIGLATTVCSDDDLLAEATAYAAALAAQPPLAIWAIKETMTTVMDAGAEAAATLDRYRSGMLKMTEDTLEAHVAWRERRDPNYRIR